MKKTRHLILYHNHLRNDGPPLYYFLGLKKLYGEKNVMHLIPEGDIRRYGQFDYTWWIDYGEDSYVPEVASWEFPETLGKTIYVVSDAHIQGTNYRYEQAKKFDYVFFNQKHYIEKYKQHILSGGKLDKEKMTLTITTKNQNIHYLPHAGDPQAYPHTTIIPKWDVVFIGHIQEYEVGNGIGMNRLDFLDAMFKEFPSFYFGARNSVWPEKNMFEDAANKFNKAKVVLNISIGNDLNMRFFETLVAGGFLLTNKIPELKNAEQYGFIDGVHYMAYNSLEDAKKKAHYYLVHDDEREKIQKAGHKQALKTGTYLSRIKEVMEKIA